MENRKSFYLMVFFGLVAVFGTLLTRNLNTILTGLQATGLVIQMIALFLVGVYYGRIIGSD